MSEALGSFFIVLGIAVVLTFVLIAGSMIGSAAAYDNQADRNFQIQCIDQGGHMEYVTNVGKVCKK